MSFPKQSNLLLAILLTIFVSFSIQSQDTLPYYPSPSWSPDGTKIAIISGYNVEIYDSISLELISSLAGHTDLIPSVTWNPDGNMLATPSFDETVKIWDVSDGSLIYELIGHNQEVTQAVWSPIGDTILSFGIEFHPNLFIWNAKNGQLIATSNFGTIVNAMFSNDNTKLALLGLADVSINSSDDLTSIVSSFGKRCCEPRMYELDWSPDGIYLATGSVNGLVEIWDATTLQVVRELHVNPYFAEDPFTITDLALSWVRDVRFSTDSQTVLAISGDGTINEWDIATGELLSEINLEETITSVAFSPSNDRIAYTTSQGAIEVIPNPFINHL